MTHPQRIGLYLWPTPDHDGGYERALWADEQGYDDIWFPDGDGMKDAMTFAAVVAGQTKRARLCTGVVPVFTRSPAILATSAITINHMAPGRFVLGLGSSTHAMVENWYGSTFSKPVTAVRESVQILKSILAGEKTNHDGKVFRSRGFRLKEQVDGQIPIHLGAMGPKMMELVGEVADGVILNNFTPLQRMDQALERIDAGAKRAGRRAEDIEVVARLALIVTEKPQEALEYFRNEITFYGSTPIYQQIYTLCGWGEQAQAIADGFKARDRKRIMAAVPDEMVEYFFTWGDLEFCQNRVREFYKAGADTVVVAPVSPDQSEFNMACEAFTPAKFKLAS
jgi:probable F420-dependent oxidoreductase